MATVKVEIRRKIIIELEGVEIDKFRTLLIWASNHKSDATEIAPSGMCEFIHTLVDATSASTGYEDYEHVKKWGTCCNGSDCTEGSKK